MEYPRIKWFIAWYGTICTVPYLHSFEEERREERRQGFSPAPSSHLHLQFPVLLHHEKIARPYHSDDAIKRTAAKLTTPRAIIIISTIILSGIRGDGCDPPTQEHDTYHNTHHPSSSSVDTRTKVNYYLMFSPSAYQAIQSKRLL